MTTKKRIYGADLVRVNATLSDEDREYLRKVGGGNASEGIRILIKKDKGQTK